MVSFFLPACRELLENHPESVRIREQVEALEGAIPDQPGMAVSLCRSVLETTCKTILKDHGVDAERTWKGPKLVAEALKCVDLGAQEDGSTDPRLKGAVDSMVRGIQQIVHGLVEVRNDHGVAAHGADAYSPLLDSHYAEIVARATDSVVGILFKMHLRRGEGGPLARFQYGDHKDFDDYIDANFGPFEVLEIPLVASEALYHTDFQGYRQGLVEFRQDQDDATPEAEPQEDEP
jgi:hypothetical protein